ncbi:MAG: hypothetical protein ACLFWF_13175 [Alphaproteobacteria bacterium]
MSTSPTCSSHGVLHSVCVRIALTGMAAALAVSVAVPASATQTRIPTGFMKEVHDAEMEALTAMRDAINIYHLSEEALEAARAALSAGPEDERQRHLKDYERARDAAAGLSPERALKAARRDRAEAKTLIVKALKRELDRDDLLLVLDLDETSMRRVELLDKAQANLKKAARIAEEARAALTSPKPPAAAGR